MHNFVHEMLHNSLAGRRIEALWQARLPPTHTIIELMSVLFFQEYEDQLTPEARFVKGTTCWLFAFIMF